nr:peptide chain release factor N(5)-glutamine methyltransferase [Bacteroidia bacterium]
MRISDNSLKAMQAYYKKELVPIYGEGETQALFELAVEHYLGIPKAKLASELQQRLQQSEVLDIYDCAKALKQQLPLQHILGEAWFMGLKFKVNRHVLIPRPETEELCDRIIKENKNAKQFLDIGTGSGCIPISLKKHLPSAEVFACDVCAEALELALENALLNNTEIQFFKNDVLASDFPSHVAARFDVIVSNPPYVLRSEAAQMEKQVLEHEPHLALFVEGTDPILFYRKIIEHCSLLLNPGGRLYLELNPLTAHEVQALASSSGLFREVNLIKDMSGKQ